MTLILRVTEGPRYAAGLPLCLQAALEIEASNQMGGRQLGRVAAIGHYVVGLSATFADAVGSARVMLHVILLGALIIVAFTGLQALPALAEKRVALVIGNADYKVGRLANPVNDAEAMAEAFKSQLKFDTVILRKDLKRGGFVEALREMARASAGAELGVVFFAGHGIEVAGRNYLIPTDAALATPADIEFEAIALDTVLRQLDDVARLRLVILDACRSNPFPVAKRGTRGLGRVEPDGGTLVAYAAKDGTTADDGKGRQSPFTAALLKRIVMPGLDVRRVFGYVSDDVKAATNRGQMPYLYGQLGGEEVYFVPAAKAAEEATKAADDTKSEPTKLVALPKLEQPQGRGLYDGSWTVNWASSGTPCVSGTKGSYSFEIVNGAILDKKGSVSASGDIHWIAISRLGGRVSYSGKLGTTSGSGTFKVLNAVPGYCRHGTFTAKRS